LTVCSTICPWCLQEEHRSNIRQRSKAQPKQCYDSKSKLVVCFWI